jgi:hypothetical protein
MEDVHENLLNFRVPITDKPSHDGRVKSLLQGALDILLSPQQDTF